MSDCLHYNYKPTMKMVRRIRQSSLRSKLWQIVLSAGDFLVLFILKMAVSHRKNDKTAVFVIRLDGIGDFILWLDAAKEISRIYPSSQYDITLMANEDWFELAKKTSYFNHVWPINRSDFYRKLLYRYRVLWRVRRSSFDIVIQSSCSRRFYHHDAIVRFSGAPHRVGLTGDWTNITQRHARKSDQWYTKLVPLSPNVEHELDRNAALVRNLGQKEFIAAVPVLRGSFPHRKIPSRDYFVLFPGAGWDGRMWPAGWFGEIAGRIYRKTGWCCVICGGPGEIYTTAKISENKNDIPMHNLVGKTSLLALVGIIQKARFVVANETSAIHIATAVATPSVCILGGGHYGRFVPYPKRLRSNKAIQVPVYRQMDCFGCNWECIFEVEDGAAVPCIKGISVEAVWEATFEAVKMDKKPC